jgi:hypothetical protein
MATHMPREPGVYRVPEPMEEKRPPLTEMTEERASLPYPLTLQEWRAWARGQRSRTP